MEALAKVAGRGDEHAITLVSGQLQHERAGVRIDALRDEPLHCERTLGG